MAAKDDPMARMHPTHYNIEYSRVFRGKTGVARWQSGKVANWHSGKVAKHIQPGGVFVSVLR